MGAPKLKSRWNWTRSARHHVAPAVPLTAALRKPADLLADLYGTEADTADVRENRYCRIIARKLCASAGLSAEYAEDVAQVMALALNALPAEGVTLSYAKTHVELRARDYLYRTRFGKDTLKAKSHTPYAAPVDDDHAEDGQATPQFEVASTAPGPREQTQHREFLGTLTADQLRLYENAKPYFESGQRDPVTALARDLCRDHFDVWQALEAIKAKRAKCCDIPLFHEKKRPGAKK